MIGFINDTYANRSTKSEIRADNGDPGPRTCIKGVAQDMPQRLRWSELLHYIDKKTDSFDLLLKYIVSWMQIQIALWFYYYIKRENC